jgi:hypothetical protein
MPPKTLADLTRCQPEATLGRHPGTVPAEPLTCSYSGQTLAKGHRFAIEKQL